MVDEIKYDTFVNILDKICSEAPRTYKTYHPNTNNPDDLIKARSLALTHLFLKVKFGLINFNERFSTITDGGQDGGLDGYYIDVRNLKIFLIQSKFSATSKSLKSKSISPEDLFKMEVKRILEGETEDMRGNLYNNKIKKFQKELRALKSFVEYKKIVIIIANRIKLNHVQIKRLVGNFEFEIYNYEKIYNDLIFPLIAGINYDPEEITITINTNKNAPLLKQEILVENGKCETTVALVPTLEIAKIMDEYRNSILKFNPRNYLSLSKNKVNKKIQSSILDYTSNDFAVMNNGITMVCDSVIDGKIPIKGRGQLVIKNPQIINGGQTAYTLSEIYQENPTSIFDGKEVLLRITSISDKEHFNDLDNFIQKISVSTNQQSKVIEADRRSNDPIQIALQDKIYNEYGYFYERKKGEFYSGLLNEYINRARIIDRDKFIRSYLAYKGNPSDARRSGSDQFFKYENFKRILGEVNNFKEMFLAFKIYQYIKDFYKSTGRIKAKRFGFALTYGTYSLIAAFGCQTKRNKIDNNFIFQDAHTMILEEITKWKKFEDHVIKKKRNQIYFKNKYDFDNYYKGETLNNDIKYYFR